MRFDIISVFPEQFNNFLETSMIKRGIEKGAVEINVHDLRKYSENKHKKIDDRPYGGGVGMVLNAFPIISAVRDIKIPEKNTLVLLTSPSKNIFNTSCAKRYAKYDQVVIICGHYEGVDERVKQLVVDETVSIGEFVLTGGELASMVIVDATSRMINGFFEKEGVAENESYSDKQNIEHPQYTRPEIIEGLKVPQVLLSGNHKEIEKWQEKNSY